jgi:hypothetical protein
MRAPAELSKRAQRNRSVPASTPAPYKGLNTVDSLADMDPSYGLSIQNFIATPQGLSVREGYRNWATGLPGDVTTLMPYHSAISSNSKLFAVSVSGFYDVTTGGVVGAPVVSGLNSGAPWWQFASQTATTSGKNYLLAVNGSDSPRLFDGSTWTACSQTASPITPGQFSNVDNNGAAVNIQAFVDVTLHQQRMWFVSTNSTKAYYTDIATPTGQLYAFDFGPLFPRGGRLYKLAAWSVNMGSVAGVQSNLVAISDKGDVVIFVGNNPAVAASWSLSAVYLLGAPTGRRCTQDFESDLLYLSRDGLYPLSQYIQSSTLNNTSAITTKISPTIGDLIETFGTNPGFEMALYPGQNIMLLNIPQSTTSANFQFCFNTVTNGWTQFTGWPAASWGLFNNSLFFGASGAVCLSFIGYADGADIAGVGGNNIVATALTAFSYFDNASRGGLGRGVLKHVHQVKPYVITGVANPLIRVGVNVDFNLIPIIGSATVNPITGAVWDNAKWDDPSATWVGSLTTYNQWTTPLCYDGDALAFGISISATAQTLWASTGWIIEPGATWG